MPIRLRLLALLLICLAFTSQGAEPTFAAFQECKRVLAPRPQCPTGWVVKYWTLSFGTYSIDCCKRTPTEVAVPRCAEPPTCGPGRRAECTSRGNCVMRMFGGGRSPSVNCIAWRCVNPASHRR